MTAEEAIILFAILGTDATTWSVRDMNNRLNWLVDKGEDGTFSPLYEILDMKERLNTKEERIVLKFINNDDKVFVV